MHKAYKKASPKVLANGIANEKFERMVKRAEKKIINSQRITPQSLAEALVEELFHKPGTLLTTAELQVLYGASGCTPPTIPTSCDPNADRSIDGTCNNLHVTFWGSVNTPFRRLIPPQYEDGVGTPRGFQQSQGPSPFSPPIPSPRVVIDKILVDEKDLDFNHTQLLMQFGQFVAHDVAMVTETGEVCPNMSCVVDDQLVGTCFPFVVPIERQNIMVTMAVSSNCAVFPRSLGSCLPNASELESGRVVRQQLNAVTHFLDASTVYGSDNDTLQIVRNLTSGAPKGSLNVGPPDPGKLYGVCLKHFEGHSCCNAVYDILAQRPHLQARGIETMAITHSLFLLSGDSSRYLLPTAVGNQTLCPAPETDCFLAGDVRVNLQEALATVHHLWFREHNRIAKRIAELNGGYSSDQVFQVARQILIAELQKIVYKDYLPIILGSAYSQMSTYKGYNPAINPSVANSYDAAAGRFGHSMVQPFFERLGVNYTQVPEGPLILAGSFFNTSSIRTYGVDVMARGLVHNESRIVDRFFTSTLSHQLFTSKPTDPGMDLISINLQRGRDHGLPPYVTWKQWALSTCKLASDFVNSSTVERLFRQVYGSLASVDLYAGSVSEQHVKGGLVGATFACIIIQNFAALRDGDRFYYENVLTRKQIHEINAKASMSQLICDNTNISTIQRNAFLRESRVDCTDIPSVNLDLWGPPRAAEKSSVHEEKTEAVESLSEEVMRFTSSDAEAKKELSMALMEEVLREIESRG
jgi:hypothetical protein